MVYITLYKLLTEYLELDIQTTSIVLADFEAELRQAFNDFEFTGDFKPDEFVDRVLGSKSKAL